MKQFLIIIALITIATDSFAACYAGYYEQSFTAPTSDGNSYGYCSHDRKKKWNDTSVSAGQWFVTWTSGDMLGTARGESSCNTTSGSNSPASSNSMTNSASGPFCWCTITSWTPSGGNTTNLSAGWVYTNYQYSSQRDCAYYCTNECAGLFKLAPWLRSSISDTISPTCTACPDGGTSTAGATAITQCYIPSSTNFNDAAGTYHFTNNCYYTN